MKIEEKLEQKMFEAIEKARVEWGQAFGGNLHRFMAKEVAKIALELAKEAYEFGIDRTNDIRPFSEFIKNYGNRRKHE